MKTIGLVGGTGWVSTVEYYKIINEEVNRRLGGLQFARCILYSLNYGDINKFNRLNDKTGILRLVSDASNKLVLSGVDCLVLCANTFHQFVDALEKEIPIPIIHIADATSFEIKKHGLNKVGLLGTKQTMEMDFYKKKLNANGIEVVVPSDNDREFIQYTIENELIKSIFGNESKERFLQFIDGLVNQGAQGIILGCTEIPLLINQADTGIKLFNTLEIHAKAAVDFALNE